MCKLFIVAILVTVTLPAMNMAQDQPSLKPLSVPSPPESRGPLTLEITYNPALPTTYLDIRGPTEKPTWIWVTKFVTIPGWQLPQGSLPIRAVRLEPLFNGETTDVTISLLRGQTTFEQEELVGKYHLGIGDHRIVTRLQSFGIEPFDIAITNAVREPPPLPVLDVRTSAIEVVGVESLNLPSPAYLLKMRNLTEKNISALKVDVIGGVSAFFQGREGQVLIKPGEVHEELLPLTNRARQNETASILFSSTVFDDGTYDGDGRPACSFVSFSAGRALWLRRILPLLEQQIREGANESAPGPQQFKDKVLALNLDPTELDKKKLSLFSSTCTSAEWSVKATSQSQKLELLRELDQIISTRPAPPVDFKSWLETKRKRFADWLARLEPPSR
jgi:hypothetical protein